MCSCKELLAKERNDLYWQFLEQWMATDEFVKYHTDRECVQYIEEKGQFLSWSTSVSSFPAFSFSAVCITQAGFVSITCLRKPCAP